MIDLQSIIFLCIYIAGPLIAIIGIIKYFKEKKWKRNVLSAIVQEWL